MHFRLTVSCLSVVLLISCFCQPLVHAQEKYDPDHPEVQDMINKGLAFIENNTSQRVGDRVMYALAAYKAQVLTSIKPKEHPFIDAAIAKIRERCTASGLEGGQDHETMYASALSAIFMLELDSERYSSEIQVILDHIYTRQQDSGAWGYRSEPNVGDTSQMQYIALALWLAKEKGFKVRPAVSKSALEWVIETQGQDGGWVYKRPIPATANELGRDTRHSIVAAGLGTAYLYADLLQLIGQGGNFGPKVGEDPDLPQDVVDVTHEDDPESDTDARRPLISFDRGNLVRTLNSGNRWFQSNFEVDIEHYNLYYLYGFERYAALREYIEGEDRGIKNWYDRGVEHLKDLQGNNGSLAKGGGEIPAPVQTAFAILFLTRSTSITIQSKASNELTGGAGFKSGAIIREQGDKLIQGGVDRSVSDLISLLENPSDDEWKLYLDSLDEVSFDGDEVSRNEQLATLRGLITHEKFEARMIGVQFLSRQRSLENAPAFIFALTDPDERVVIEAHEALRFLSRRVDTPTVSERPSQSEINQLKRYWKAWYKRVQPDGILLTEPEDAN